MADVCDKRTTDCNANLLYELGLKAFDVNEEFCDIPSLRLHLPQLRLSVIAGNNRANGGHCKQEYEHQEYVECGNIGEGHAGFLRG